MSGCPTKSRNTASARIWLLDGSLAGEDALALAGRLLSPSEQARLLKFRRPLRRDQYLLGHLLLRLAASCLCGLPADALDVIDRPGSAPLLVLPPDIPAPYFSLSHSGRWIACAVSMDTALGLDIETMSEKRDVLALSEAAFDDDEHAFIRRCDPGSRDAAFYRIWTMKEALFKLSSGAGIRWPALPSTVDTAGLLSSGDGWFAAAPAHPRLCISVCSRQALDDIAWMDAQCLLTGLPAA